MVCNLAANQAGCGFRDFEEGRPMGQSKLKLAKSQEMLMSCTGVQTARRQGASSVEERERGDAEWGSWQTLLNS
jgi:hypothetical protein